MEDFLKIAQGEHEVAGIYQSPPPGGTPGPSCCLSPTTFCCGGMEASRPVRISLVAIKPEVGGNSHTTARRLQADVQLLPLGLWAVGWVTTRTVTQFPHSPVGNSLQSHQIGRRNGCYVNHWLERACSLSIHG